MPTIGYSTTRRMTHDCKFTGFNSYCPERQHCKLPSIRHLCRIVLGHQRRHNPDLQGFSMWCSNTKLSRDEAHVSLCNKKIIMTNIKRLGLLYPVYQQQWSSQDEAWHLASFVFLIERLASYKKGSQTVEDKGERGPTLSLVTNCSSLTRPMLWWQRQGDSCTCTPRDSHELHRSAYRYMAIMNSYYSF